MKLCKTLDVIVQFGIFSVMLNGSKVNFILMSIRLMLVRSTVNSVVINNTKPLHCDHIHLRAHVEYVLTENHLVVLDQGCS